MMAVLGKTDDVTGLMGRPTGLWDNSQGTF